MPNKGDDSVRRSLWPEPLKYLGLTTLLAWHYCLWFVPTVYSVPLLGDNTTYAWLLTLSFTTMAMLLGPLILARLEAGSGRMALMGVCAFFLSTCSGLLMLVPSVLDILGVAAVVACLQGLGFGTMWLLWGNAYIRGRSRFSLGRVPLVFGATLLLSLTIAYFLPSPANGVFVTALPLFSWFIGLMYNRNLSSTSLPAILPKTINAAGRHSVVVVCLISFAASTACYFLVAIVVWQDMPLEDVSFTLGVAIGAALMLALAVLLHKWRGGFNIYRLFPWLLVLAGIACALFLGGTLFHTASFLLALAVSSVLGLLLMMYFGALTLKGYLSSFWAFGLSGASIWIGILCGNALALSYESASDGLWQALATHTDLTFICILLILVIPLVRKEYEITSMTEPLANVGDLQNACAGIAAEFGLSAREVEILMLVARGLTTNNISTRLVISANTVNTHIRNIYSKLNIHKRSELLDYIDLCVTSTREQSGNDRA